MDVSSDHVEVRFAATPSTVDRAQDLVMNEPLVVPSVSLLFGSTTSNCLGWRVTRQGVEKMRAQALGLDHRVAVFIDVENVLGWLKRGGCTELLRRARELGVVSIRRAFGDFSNPSVASRQIELQRCGFDLVHTLHPAKSKSNSADISMTIDVMESCREPDIQWVILATGDSDFGPVFRRLREMGKLVVGVGPPSVLSNSVFTSCHEFILTDDPGSQRRRGRGGRGTWEHYPGAGTGGSYRSTRPGIVPGTRLCYPPNALSIRGGFRMTHQVPPRGLIEGPSPGLDFTASLGKDIGTMDDEQRAQPLLLEAPETREVSVTTASTHSNGVGSSGVIARQAVAMMTSCSVGMTAQGSRDSRERVAPLGTGMVTNSAALAIASTDVGRTLPAGSRDSSPRTAPDSPTGSPRADETGLSRAEIMSSSSVGALDSSHGSATSSPCGAILGSPGPAPASSSSSSPSPAIVVRPLQVVGAGSPPTAPAGPPPVEDPASDPERNRGVPLSRPEDVLLPPGQLLLPKMVTGAARNARPVDPPAPAAQTTAQTTRTHTRKREENNTVEKSEANSTFSSRSSQQPGFGDCNYRPEERRQGGLGALSAIRPSEKLYHHLLALDSTSESGLGSLACDWGYGLSEMTLARGLVSLALACGAQQDSAHSRAVEALLGATRVRSPRGMPPSAAVANLGGAGGNVGGESVSTTGFSRQEACRIATLLQRCGFLSWLHHEQQWLVTVPADMEVLRRRRDDILMEELRTRCQEASVPFEPSLAVNLLWAAKARI